jgi:hypothetical protein
MNHFVVKYSFVNPSIYLRACFAPFARYFRNALAALLRYAVCSFLCCNFACLAVQLGMVQYTGSGALS